MKTNTLYVAGLDPSITETSLHMQFAKHAAIERVTIIKDKITKQSKGFGYVLCASHKDATDALKEMDGRIIADKPIKVKYSYSETPDWLTNKANPPPDSYGNNNNNNFGNNSSFRGGGRGGYGPPRGGMGMRGSPYFRGSPNARGGGPPLRGPDYSRGRLPMRGGPIGMHPSPGMGRYPPPRAAYDRNPMYDTAPQASKMTGDVYNYPAPRDDPYASRSLPQRKPDPYAPQPAPHREGLDPYLPERRAQDPYASSRDPYARPVSNDIDPYERRESSYLSERRPVDAGVPKPAASYYDRYSTSLYAERDGHTPTAVDSRYEIPRSDSYSTRDMYGAPPARSYADQGVSRSRDVNDRYGSVAPPSRPSYDTSYSGGAYAAEKDLYGQSTVKPPVRSAYPAERWETKGGY